MVSGQAATLAVLAVAGFLVPRILGAENYGRYAAALAVVTLMQTTASLGLHQVEVRYLAPLWHQGKTEDAVELGSSLWLTRLGLAVIAGGLAGAWLYMSHGLGLKLRTCALLGLLCALRTSVQATRGLLLPLGRVGRMAAFEFFRSVLILPLVVLVYLELGLEGVFLALVALNTIFLIVITAMVLKVLPLRPSAFALGRLRPYWRYSFSTFTGMLAGVFQSQFSVYAVGAWMARSEAGILAVALMIYQVLRNLLHSARRALMPVLAEMQDRGEVRRLRFWGDLMQRYGAGLALTVLIAWSLVGRLATRVLLGPEYSAVYPCTMWVLLGLIFFTAGASCQALLYVCERAGRAAINLVVYAAVTGLGLAWVLQGEETDSAIRVSICYAVASAIFWVCTYFSLGREGIWLPLKKMTLLVLPLFLIWPASNWGEASLWSVLALPPLLALLAAYAIGLRLLPPSEVREVILGLRQGRRVGPRDLSSAVGSES